MDCSVEQANGAWSSSTSQKNEDLKAINGHSTKFQKYMMINKPMIPLKTSLFLWYGGAATILPFFNLYVLQLGISISQFSLIFTLNPLTDFIATTLSGIIADRIGRSKPVLMGNIILTAIAINSILLVPEIKTRKCFIEDVVEIQCNPKFSIKTLRQETSDMNNSLECIMQCGSKKVFYHSVTLYEAEFDATSFSNNTKQIPRTISNLFVLKDDEVSSRNVTSVDSKSFCRLIMNNGCESFCRNNIEPNTSRKMQCLHVEDNSVLVVTLCTIIFCFYSAVYLNCYSLMDVTSMFMAKTFNSDFGRERFWSILGIALMTPFASYLIDLTTPEGEPRNCLTAIYFIDVIFVLLVISIYKLEVEIKPLGRNMMKNSKKLLKNVDIMVFILSVLVLGNCKNFNDVYSFIYLDRLGAPSILMGLIMGMNSMCGLPFLLTSDWWLQKFGSSNLLFCGFVGHVINFLGYSFLQNAWHAIIFETSSIFTYHLLWVAVVRHSHEIAPEGLAATVISCAGGIHWALGKGAGGLIGGQVMNAYGERWAYRVMAVFCGIYGVFYGVFIHSRRKKKRTTKHKLKSTSEKLKLTSPGRNEEANKSDSIIY